MIYIGLDLTSAFSPIPRQIDGAVLDENLEVRFFRMSWPAAAIVVQRDGAAIMQAILQAAGIRIGTDLVLAVDGPQGLAAIGNAFRHCERLLGTSGHTPAVLPPPQNGGPVYMGGYIRSSLDFFAALVSVPSTHLAGIAGNGLPTANLFEVFPGAEWTILAGRKLANKELFAGRQQRRKLLTQAGVQMPLGIQAPSADQNDAGVSAYLAWCTRHAAARVALVGHAPHMAAAEMREGYILHATQPLQQAQGGQGFDVVEERQPVTADETVAPPDEWNDENCERLLLIDDGLVHGSEPENAWLATGTDYRCSTCPPHPRAQFLLQHSVAFEGRRGWTMAPSIHAIRNALGFAVPQYLSRANAITLRVNVEPIE